jgi:hypothetical protein
MAAIGHLQIVGIIDGLNNLSLGQKQVEEIAERKVEMCPMCESEFLLCLKMIELFCF